MAQISARNQFTGTVAAIKEGAVNGVVTIDVGEALLKCGITMEAIRELGLMEGCRATAVAKATNVLVARGTERLPVSSRNQLPGTCARVTEGAVNGIVEIETPGGLTVRASITNEAIRELGLAEGSPCIAIIKATDVMVATAD